MGFGALFRGAETVSNLWALTPFSAPNRLFFLSASTLPALISLPHA
jgi:hypothetical protein